MFDVEHFIAIINPPEAAILALGSVRELPVVKDGQVVPGLRMKATLSVDHRVSDGAEAARFLQADRQDGRAADAAVNYKARKVQHMSSAAYELGYLKAGMELLESYLQSNDLYWTIARKPTAR